MRRTQRLSTGFELANELERAARTLWVPRKLWTCSVFCSMRRSSLAKSAALFRWHSAPKRSMTRCWCEAIHFDGATLIGK